MDGIRSLDEATSMAERACEEEEETRQSSHPGVEIEDLLTDYVHRISTGAAPWEDVPKSIGAYIDLAQSLLGLGMKKESMDLTNATLRKMELDESDRVVYPDAGIWNQLGALLAAHGDLMRAKATLKFALDRAHQFKTHEISAILANLSEASLQMGDAQAAGLWADKALAAPEHPWERDLDARLTANRVKLAIARTHRDTEDLRSALGRFSESVGLLVERDGNLSPRAIDAQVALAAAQHESEPDGQALTDLEALHVTAQVVLGPKRREAIIAQATLAVAEFGAAGGWDGVDDERTRAAVETLEAAKNYATASLDLGRAHPQTRILQEALADMRAAGMTDGKAAYQIEKVYLPQDSGQRNAAKKAALQAENNVIRLIAHAGASYFLSQFDFYQPVIAALDRKVHFNVIISSPWSTLAAFLPSDPTADPGNYGNIEALVRKSPYYNDAYLKVTESYQRLKDRYPDHVELRVTPMDIAGSTLLTSDVGFFEPYTTSDPNGRTLRGMSAFEVMYRKDSQYYHDARKEFTTQWELSSTWGEFQKTEQSHIETLQTEMQAHGHVHVREKVRRGEVPLP